MASRILSGLPGRFRRLQLPHDAKFYGLTAIAIQFSLGVKREVRWRLRGHRPVNRPENELGVQKGEKVSFGSGTALQVPGRHVSC